MKIPASSAKMAALASSNFEAKAAIVHGSKYGYSKVVYTNCHNKVIIECKIHGEFQQSPSRHLKGDGCPQCGMVNALLNNKNIKEKAAASFAVKAASIHGDKYNYSKTRYINTKTKVVITCRVHGDFEQLPRYHLWGQGCPLCKESRGEATIANWLKDNGIEYTREKKILGFSKVKAFDFYLPKLELYVEYDGEQHFLPMFGTQRLNKQKERDIKANNYCRENKIRLLRIAYHENVVEKLEKEVYAS